MSTPACGCTPEFLAYFRGGAHDPDTCPLADDCARRPHDSVPCGSCDRCLLAQVACAGGADYREEDERDTRDGWADTEDQAARTRGNR